MLILGSVLTIRFRKPPSSRPRPTSSSSALPSLMRPSRSSSRGCVTRTRSSSASSRSLPSPLLPRSTRSLRTPRFSSRSSSRALLMLSVSNPLPTLRRSANYSQASWRPRPCKWAHCIRHCVQNYKGYLHAELDLAIPF